MTKDMTCIHRQRHSCNHSACQHVPLSWHAQAFPFQPLNSHTKKRKTKGSKTLLYPDGGAYTWCLRRLTGNVGTTMAALPLDPQIAAALVAAGDAGCASEAAVVAAVLSVRSIWYGNPRSTALREAQMRFAVAEGAHQPFDQCCAAAQTVCR